MYVCMYVKSGQRILVGTIESGHCHQWVITHSHPLKLLLLGLEVILPGPLSASLWYSMYKACNYTTNFLEFGSHENHICNRKMNTSHICNICNFYVDHAILAGSYKTHMMELVWTIWDCFASET